MRAYDRDKLVELFGDDPTTVAEVEREFLDTARGAEKEIVGTDNLTVIARAAHRLKGASGVILATATPAFQSAVSAAASEHEQRRKPAVAKVANSGRKERIIKSSSLGEGRAKENWRGPRTVAPPQKVWRSWRPGSGKTGEDTLTGYSPRSADRLPKTRIDRIDDELDTAVPHAHIHPARMITARGKHQDGSFDPGTAKFLADLDSIQVRKF